MVMMMTGIRLRQLSGISGDDDDDDDDDDNILGDYGKEYSFLVYHRI